MEYSSNAKGNLGVTLGAVGTGLGLLDEILADKPANITTEEAIK